MYVPLPVGLGVAVDPSDPVRHSVIEELDPFQASAGDATDTVQTGTIVVRTGSGRRRYEELQLLSGDGHVTGHDGERLWLLDGDGACSVPPLDAQAPIDIVLDGGYSTARAFRSVVRPALQLAIAARGGVAIHAASVEIEGRAVLVAGWSESGKTETALALVEAGGSFLTDKWTVVTPDRRAAAFPIGVGVRGWVLRYLPRLGKALPRGARAQLRLAAAGRFVSSPLERWRGGGRATRLAVDALRRSVALGDRAALTPSRVRRIYGDEREPARELPIDLVAVLRTRPDRPVELRDGDLDRLSLRLALSASTERGDYLALQQRAAYAEARRFDPAELVERDRTAIASLLRDVPIIEVSAPFPTDPRPIAAVIAARR